MTKESEVKTAEQWAGWIGQRVELLPFQKDYLIFAFRECTSELKEENTRLREALKGLIGMAEDGYKLHVKNGSHQEFLQEDKEALRAAHEALNPQKP